ncbi:hypothetical protein QVD17_37251 [Tagetes erecta]|uniref:Uncharacterized protein n=1 Tax=Tagetes erecta TaxID=13708 RepID=A0AAD8JXW3_TARER|nr:hypothetical protein QVD17_37251 [Tagetes erecta]
MQHSYSFRATMLQFSRFSFQLHLWINSGFSRLRYDLRCNELVLVAAQVASLNKFRLQSFQKEEPVAP